MPPLPRIEELTRFIASADGEALAVVANAILASSATSEYERAHALSGLAWSHVYQHRAAEALAAWAQIPAAYPFLREPAAWLAQLIGREDHRWYMSKMILGHLLPKRRLADARAFVERAPPGTLSAFLLLPLIDALLAAERWADALPIAARIATQWEHPAGAVAAARCADALGRANEASHWRARATELGLDEPQRWLPARADFTAAESVTNAHDAPLVAVIGELLGAGDDDRLMATAQQLAVAAETKWGYANACHGFAWVRFRQARTSETLIALDQGAAQNMLAPEVSRVAAR